MTRNPLIRLIAIFAVLLILSLSGLALFRNWQDEQARVDQRLPLEGLGYCTSDQVTPCVVSFGVDSKDNMLVSFLTEGAFYPDFYLKIRADEDEHTYVCQKSNTFSTSVYCSGQELPIGKVYQFRIFSLHEDVLLAQGNFPIIGIALVTPEVVSTPTSSATPTVISTPEATDTPSYPSYP